MFIHRIIVQCRPCMTSNQLPLPQPPQILQTAIALLPTLNDIPFQHQSSPYLCLQILRESVLLPPFLLLRLSPPTRLIASIFPLRYPLSLPPPLRARDPLHFHPK